MNNKFRTMPVGRQVKNYKILFCFTRKYLVVAGGCFFVFLFLFCGVNVVRADVTCEQLGGQCQSGDCGPGIPIVPGASDCDGSSNNFCCGVVQPSSTTQTTNTGGGLVPAPSGGGGEGDYTLNDFVKVFINLATWILGITGSLALLFFIYGGVMFLISGGSSERVQQAKQIIVGSIIGVVIVLTSFMIISFVLTSLGYNVATFGVWSQLK